MSGSLRAVRAGLATRLATLDIRAYDTWPSSINPPVAIVRPLEGSYHETFDDQVTYQLEITLLLQMGHLQAGQEQLDAYVATTGTSSIKAALEADPSLGGAADSVMVKGWRDYGSLQVGEDAQGHPIEYLGCKFQVEVFA